MIYLQSDAHLLMLQGEKPMGKLDRNVENLFIIPKIHTYTHVVPIDEKSWNPISFYNFLLELDPQLKQSSFVRGRRDHYKSYGSCNACGKELYHILINKFTKKLFLF